MDELRRKGLAKMNEVYGWEMPNIEGNPFFDLTVDPYEVQNRAADTAAKAMLSAELDEQIERFFMGVNENIYRTKSGADLIATLQAAGHVVAFKNNDRTDIRIENLQLLSKRELMLRNTIHNYPRPVRDAIRLVAKVKRRINAEESR